MGGRLRAAVLVAMLGSMIAAWTLPAAAEPAFTYADRFASSSFSGNDGDLAFTGPWIELGESDGPEAGAVSVWSDEHCAAGSGWCLKIGGDGVAIRGHGVVREADMTGATAATLRYSFRRAVFEGYDNGEWVKVQVSGDGGASWKTVARHKLDRSDERDIEKARDITDFAGPHTQIRLLGGPADSVEAHISFDDIVIEMTPGSPPTTTTTTEASTTTTATTVMTTTTPVASTTTSTVAPTTSTTAATRSATTTTAAPSRSVPTTTLPAAPSTTTTTTVAVLGVARSVPPDDVPPTTRPVPAPVPGTPESFVSKIGLTMTNASPAVYTGDEAASASGSGGGLDRTPVERLGATFATTAETLRNHTVWTIALGVIVAWLALHGLGKTRRRDAGEPGSVD